jgi:DNA polymerase I
VGEKTAAKLITAYGGLDGIFANLDAQTPKLRENLATYEAQARKNWELMVLHATLRSRSTSTSPA